MADAKIESRYLVIKLKDAHAFLSPGQRWQLHTIMEAITDGRARQNRAPLSGIFCEEDWPEFVPLQDAILARASGQRDLFETDA